MGQQRESDTKRVEVWEREQRGKTLMALYDGAKMEHDFYDRVIREAPIKARSGIDQEGTRRPLFWFHNRRSELRRKWGF